MQERPEIDRWIISLLNSLIVEVEEALEDYEPTRAGRAIQDFVTENLSNWYVRLNRKRFWGGEYNTDKVAAYQTLYSCMETVAMLAAPIAPFYCDRLFMDLNSICKKHESESVHLAPFPTSNKALIDKELEERMEMAQSISSMVLSLRRKVNIKVRQPLSKMMVPVLNEQFRKQLKAVESLILAEVNVKELEYLDDSSGILVKKIKPNFKTLGPRFGKAMKEVSAVIAAMTQEEIGRCEQTGVHTITIGGVASEITLDDVEIISEDIPGWLVTNEGRYTVALDITVSKELKQEGIARELINRIQNLRKEAGFEVTDNIKISLVTHELLKQAVESHGDYIAGQTLAKEINLVDALSEESGIAVELDADLTTSIKIEKIVK